MSEIQYGLISKVDAHCLEKTIDLICSEFSDTTINTLQIGVFDGQTDRGIYEYITRKTYDSIGEYPDAIHTHNYKCNHTAIDNNKDKEILLPFHECNLIIGNSDEVCNQIPDKSQHLIFEDSCHCFAHVVSTFFCYAPKVKVGGYLAFHDTGKHIKPFKDFQHGDKDNPDAYISVRKALYKIGLLKYTVDMSDHEFVYGNKLPDRYNIVNGFQLIFDEADETDEAGGICVFKRLS